MPRFFYNLAAGEEAIPLAPDGGEDHPCLLNALRKAGALARDAARDERIVRGSYVVVVDEDGQEVGAVQVKE